jgi:hypothetical protein
MKKFRGHRRCTHEKYSNIMAGRMTGMMIQKEEKEKK